MEFKKIDDTKFQCLLFEEDLEENNISLDDFFRNDTEKIHGLLDVVLEEARKSIGIMPGGDVMSLQLAPQPNHSLLLTVSAGRDEFSDMLKQAGQRAAEAFAGFQKEKESNVIKNNDEAGAQSIAAAEFKQVGDDTTAFFAVDCEGGRVGYDNAICRFASLEEFEHFCTQSRRTWGLHNTLYKDNSDGRLYLTMERKRCSRTKFEQFVNDLMEYGEFIPYNRERIGYIMERYSMMIADNAVNITKKYCAGD